MVSENDFIYEASKAYEGTYDINQKRISLPEENFYKEELRGFFPPFGRVRRRRIYITYKEFPKNSEEFFFQFCQDSHPLENYISKIIKAGIIDESQAPEIYAFVRGYGGMKLNNLPLGARIKALFSPNTKKFIDRVKSAYNKGLESRI